MFLIAQYFAWTEIIRREVQFIDLGQDESTRTLARLQDALYALWQRSAGFDPLLRIFAGEQRAIGERMIVHGAKGPERLGYAAFLDGLKGKTNDALIDVLVRDVEALSENLPLARARLVAIQNALIDLLTFLNPHYVRFPQERRTKVAV